MRALLGLVVMVALPAAPLGAAQPKETGAAISGTLRVEGRIEKVRKARNRRANPYGGAYGPAPAELEQKILVYLEGGPPAKIGAPVRLGQKDRNFTESVVAVAPGGEVEFSNDDDVRHHIRSRAQPWAFNLKPKAPGESAKRRFEAPPQGGIGVVPVYCDIHPDMRSHVLVVPSGRFQVLSERGGAFTLAGLPPGDYTLSAWHPTLKPVPQKLRLKPGEKRTLTLVMQGKTD